MFMVQRHRLFYITIVLVLFSIHCKKGEAPPSLEVVAESFTVNSLLINNTQRVSPVYDVDFSPTVQLSLSATVERLTLADNES